MQPVDIIPEFIFSLRRVKSLSKIYLENPNYGTTLVDVPKFNSMTGFLAVLTYESD